MEFLVSGIFFFKMCRPASPGGGRARALTLAVHKESMCTRRQGDKQVWASASYFRFDLSSAPVEAFAFCLL